MMISQLKKGIIYYNTDYIWDLRDFWNVVLVVKHQYHKIASWFLIVCVPNQ